jgi:hypothetical protein
VIPINVWLVVGLLQGAAALVLWSTLRRYGTRGLPLWSARLAFTLGGIGPSLGLVSAWRSDRILLAAYLAPLVALNLTLLAGTFRRRVGEPCDRVRL